MKKTLAESTETAVLIREAVDMWD